MTPVESDSLQFVDVTGRVSTTSLDWSLSNAPFACVCSTGARRSLHCSDDGVTQVFYTVTKNQFYFGPTVAAVAQAADLTWEWDYDALADLAVFGHLIGKRTLHKRIHRVGPSEQVIWDGKRLTSVARPASGVRTRSAGAQDALEHVVAYVRTVAEDGDVISLSAGFDSRVILAAFLALGLKPRLLVMGDDASTDVRITTEIARALGLTILRVQLDGRRMIDDRAVVSRLTSGTKTVDNWHTYEYVANSPADDITGLWIGSNGEFARTFFADRGLPFYGAECCGRLAGRAFWRLKYGRTALPDSIRRHLTPALRDSLSFDAVRNRLLSEFGEVHLGEANDRLYAERVRQFISNGLRLVSTRYKPKTPFLHTPWIATVGSMPRRWKLGNRWHRFAIARLYPRLLSFPYDDSGAPLGRSPGLAYWLGLAPYSRNTAYFDYTAFFSSRDFRKAYERSRKALPTFLLDGKRAPLENPLPLRTTAYFATLSFFCETLSIV